MPLSNAGLNDAACSASMRVAVPKQVTKAIMNGRLVRAIVPDGPSVRILRRWRGGDGVTPAKACWSPCSRRANALRRHEFSDEARAGFCLMGACQDCWVWLADGRRVRACTTRGRRGHARLNRRAAGLSTLIRVAIVGAGPAGIAAAGVLAAHGVAPVVIDEARRPGGQIYRQPRPGLRARHRGPARRRGGKLPAHACGFRAPCATASTTGRRRLPGASRIGTLHTIAGQRRRHGRVRRADPCDRRDRPHAAGRRLDAARRVHARRRAGAAQGAWLPDRPARSSSAAARRCSISRPSSIAPWAPRSSRCSTPRRSPPRLAAAADLAGGARHACARPRLHGGAAARRRADAPRRHAARLRGHGRRRSRALSRPQWRREHASPAMRVAVGFGLKPETQLAELAGAALDYDPTPSANGCRVPTRTAAAAAISTWRATARRSAARRPPRSPASLRPARCCEDAGMAVAGHRSRPIAAARGARCGDFSAALPAPSHGRWPPSTRSTTASWSAAARASPPASCARSLREGFGPTEVNRLKAITRCGMGRCQGRFCGLAAAELTAQTLGLPLEAVGRLRAQPPVKPIRSRSRRAQSCGKCCGRSAR